MNQLFKVITYCHSQNIINRDLKPENIMITGREKKGCLQIKIIGFGTAKITEKGQKEKNILFHLIIWHLKLLKENIIKNVIYGLVV